MTNDQIPMTKEVSMLKIPSWSKEQNGSGAGRDATWSAVAPNPKGSRRVAVGAARLGEQTYGTQGKELNRECGCPITSQSGDISRPRSALLLVSQSGFGTLNPGHSLVI